MVYVNFITNPFEPFNSDKEEISSNITIKKYLSDRYRCDWEKFERPTVCLLNGTAVSQKDFSEVILKDNDIISFVVLAGSIGTAVVFSIIGLAAAGAAAIYVTTNSFASQPADIVEKDVKAADSVYNLDGQTNSNKLGQPVPCGYGRVRNFPDYAAKPYNVYRDNEQYQYSLFCLGHGAYDIEDIKIGETDISNFNDVEYEIIRPNEKVTFFRDAVVTVSEGASTELLGPNEAGYDEAGPYVINPVGSEIDRIEADFVFPQGLYEQEEDGSFSRLSVTGWVKFREIDSDGNPVANPASFKAKKIVTEIPKENTKNLENYSGKWIVTSVIYEEVSHSKSNGFKEYEYSEDPLERITTYYIDRSTTWETVDFSKNLKSKTPKRFTFRIDVPYGRYEVKFARTSDKFKTFRFANRLVLESIRGYMPNTTFYGSKTLLAVKALATNNLNNQSAEKINVIQTRKLQVWDGVTWLDRVITRNPVWAAIDVLRSRYGGRLETKYIDLVTFKNLADFCDDNNLKFDYIFSTRSNVWDTIKTILAVAKMVPVLKNSRVSAVRDYQLDYPEFIYTDDNIIKGSFKRSISMRKLSDYDGLEIEYVNRNTFKQENVLCLVGNDEGNNLDNLKLIGVTNRGRAKRLGLYHRAIRKLRRELISFNTDTQGYLPTINSLIGITHNTTKWGQFDLVKSVQGNVITLASTHEFDLTETYQIIFKQRTGFASDPYYFVPSSTNTKILTVTDLSEDLSRVDGEEPLICQFGIEGSISKLVRVKSIDPIDINTVKIECTNNDNTIYSFDDIDVIDPDEISQIENDPLPTVTNINIFYTDIDSSKQIVTWDLNKSADYYLIQYSYDNESWSKYDRTYQNFYLFDVEPGQIYVRIAAVNQGRGPWATASKDLVTYGFVPNKVDGVELVEEPDDSFIVGWNADINISKYIVKAYTGWGVIPANFAGQRIFKPPVSKHLLSKHTRIEFTKNWLKNRCERKGLFFGRQWTFVVIGQNGSNTSESEPLLVEKKSLASHLPFDLTNVNQGSNNYLMTWSELGDPDDSVYYKIWISDTTGTYPPGMTAKGTSKTPSKIVNVGATRPVYWRVQVLDDWDTDEAIYASGQKTIS